MKAILRFSALGLAAAWLLAMVLMISGCVPRAIPVNVPTPPARADAVAPAVERARKVISAAATASGKLEGRVISASHKAASLKDEMRDLVKQADYLRQHSATRDELTDHWKRLSDAAEHASILQEDLAAAVALADEQKALRVQSDNALMNLAGKAYAKDAEATALRSQNGDLGSAVKAQGDVIAKTQDDAVRGKMLRHAVWLAIAAVVCIGIFFVIRTGAKTAADIAKPL